MVSAPKARLNCSFSAGNGCCCQYPMRRSSASISSALARIRSNTLSAVGGASIAAPL